MDSNSAKHMNKFSFGKAKGKAMFTSSPSISFKYNVEEQELEEILSASAKDTLVQVNEEEDSIKSSFSSSDTALQNSSDINMPPSGSADFLNAKDYLSRFSKRSTSVDAPSSESSSDIWTHLFHGIRGKISKTVEDKLEEICNEHLVKMTENKKDKHMTNSSDIEDVEAVQQSNCENSNTTDNKDVSHDTPENFEISGKSVAESEEPADITTGYYDSVVCDEIEQAVEAVDHQTQLQNNVFVANKWLPYGKGKKFISLLREWYRVIFVLLFSISWSYLPISLVSFLLGVIVTMKLLPVIETLKDFICKVDQDDTETLHHPDADLRRLSFTTATSTNNLLFETPFDGSEYEGWMNEFCAEYNPEVYHVSLTDSVYIKLKGCSLRVAETRNRIPKRAIWNEPKFNIRYNKERLYNISSCFVTLLPEGLAYKRKWSKKYPICICLRPDSFMGVRYPDKNTQTLDENLPWHVPKCAPLLDNEPHSPKEENTDVLNGSMNKSDKMRSKSEKNDTPRRIFNIEMRKKKKMNKKLSGFENDSNDSDDNGDLSADVSTKERKKHVKKKKTDSLYMYLFARTDREKELWFRRFSLAVSSTLSDIKQTEISSMYKQYRAHLEEEHERYLLHMDQFYKKVVPITPSSDVNNKVKDKESNGKIELESNFAWINTLHCRLFYDLVRSEALLSAIRDKLQRKLSAIHLPRFLESLILRDMEFGDFMPIIEHASQPVQDENGIWIDLKVSFCGFFRMAIDTKLNLLKLKKEKPGISGDSVDSPVSTTPSEFPITKKRAVYDSELEDSAETSADSSDVRAFTSQYLVDSSGQNIISSTSPTSFILGGFHSNKMLRMVDKFTSTKIFESVSEIKYIRRMMEGVSNTDLSLYVELKKLSGTLVLNIPPPPSDRLWFGFRNDAELCLSAYPKFGDVTFELISKWIERKLCTEFEKVFVFPNMDHLTVPGFPKV